MNGLVAAVVTPMNSEGEIDLSIVPAIVDHLERNKICGVYIAGSTGEGMSLTDRERQGVAEAYLEHCRGRLRTVVQVGHNSMRAAAALAAHADSCGADAISATPTGYFQAEGEEGRGEAEGGGEDHCDEQEEASAVEAQLACETRRPRALGARSENSFRPLEFR